MTHIIEVNEFGSRDVLTPKNINLRSPVSGEVLVRHTAIGLNYDDILTRQDFFGGNLPFIPGNEACGVVEEVGENIKGLHIGDRVAYVTAPNGAYSEARLIDHHSLVMVPDYVHDDDVAACLRKGMIAHYLMRRVFFVRKGNIILIHAAADDVGMLTCLMAKQYEATIIATVAENHKMQIVKDLGVDLVLNYNDQDFEQKILEFTKGLGVNVVYDFVGKSTLNKSQKVLGNFGLLVCCGFTSGLPEPIDFREIYGKSSFVTCPNIMQYKSEKVELTLSASEIFAQLQKKLIKPNLFRKYHLNEIKEAHKNIEEGKQVGQSIIIV